MKAHEKLCDREGYKERSKKKKEEKLNKEKELPKMESKPEEVKEEMMEDKGDE